MSKINLFSFIKLWFKNKKDIEDDTIRFPYRHPLSEPEIKKEKPVKVKKVKIPMKLSLWHKIAVSTSIGATIPVVVGYVQDTNAGSGLKVGSIFGGVIVAIALLVYCIAEGTKNV